MARIIRNIAVALLMAGFLVPLIGFGLGRLSGAASTTENRALNAWPSWHGDARAYTAGIDDYLSDRFGGRMALIRLSRKVRDNLGEDAPLVLRGQGPWLFLGYDAYRDEFEGNGNWPDARVDDWAADLLAARDALAERGTAMAATIAPDKARIYPEQLPDGWREGRRRFKDDLLSRPELRGVVFDTEPGILARKAAGEAVYYARDTHWNPSGAWVAADMSLDALDPERRLPRHVPAEPRTIAPRRPLDLEGMLGETETSEPPAFRIPFSERKGYDLDRPHLGADGTPQRGNFSTIVLTDKVDDDARGTLVIIGDSFADSMVLHLMRSFDRIVRIHHGADDYTVGTDEVLSYDPDAVLVLIVERSAWAKARPIVVGPSIDGEGNALPLPEIAD